MEIRCKKSVKQTIENQIFKPALELKYGKDFPHIPLFNFNELPEDEDDKVERFLKTSQAIDNITKSIKNLTDAGVAVKDTSITKLLDYFIDRLEDAETLKLESGGLIEKNDDEKEVRTVEEKEPEDKKPSFNKKPEWLYKFLWFEDSSWHGVESNEW